MGFGGRAHHLVLFAATPRLGQGPGSSLPAEAGSARAPMWVNTTGTTPSRDRVGTGSTDYWACAGALAQRLAVSRKLGRSSSLSVASYVRWYPVCAMRQRPSARR